MNIGGNSSAAMSVSRLSANAWLPWAASFAILVFVIVIVVILLARHRKKVEDPSRLTKFFDVVSKLDWHESSVGISLDELSHATTELFQAEVTYYYRTRQARRLSSSIFRWTAYLFGTLGLACPLLETAVPNWSGISRFGYVLLAIAAASLAGNELFGGTRGHIRTVKAQYELEKLLNRFVIDWTEWRCTAADKGDWKSGFDILRKLSDGIYGELLNETREWGTALSEAEKAYGAGISSKNGRRGE